MFERFSQHARDAVIGAVRRADWDNEDRVTPEHLLVALLADEGAGLAPLLGEQVTAAEISGELERLRRRGGLSDADAAALGEIGIDLGAVLDTVERSLGPDALVAPVSDRSRRRGFSRPGRATITPEFKHTLELSLRETTSLREREMRPEHLLLALLRQPGPSRDVLGAHGIRYADVRARLSSAA